MAFGHPFESLASGEEIAPDTRTSHTGIMSLWHCATDVKWQSIVLWFIGVHFQYDHRRTALQVVTCDNQMAEVLSFMRGLHCRSGCPYV